MKSEESLSNKENKHGRTAADDKVLGAVASINKKLYNS